jgi:tRNA threonylcarbamoyladenosine biosynthesis protein TsaE
MKIIIDGLAKLPQSAKIFLENMKGEKLFAFYGSMGSGKTTFIKALCEAMGTVDIATSPTFTLVNEYKTIQGESLYHFDFYRIKKIEEVFDFGLEEYLSSGAFCFMEWPEQIEDILPPETVKVKISVKKNGKRILETF